MAHVNPLVPRVQVPDDSDDDNDPDDAVSPDGQGRPDGEHQPGGLPGQQRRTLPLRPAESQETDLTKVS